MMSRQRAFTLIELLVVIAIIALLVSILLPSLNRAKDLAKSVVCQANLKGIGAALAIYAQENNMWIPGNGGWWPRRLGGEDVNWQRHLSIYDESAFDDDDTGFSGDHFNPEISYIDSKNMFHCSEDTSRPGPNEWPTIVETSYGLNSNMTWSAYDAGVNYVTSSRLFYNIEPTKRPNEMYLLCDTGAHENINWAIRTTCTTYEYTKLRHAGRCNMLFFDGHVESMLDGEIRAGYHNIAGRYGYLFWYDRCPGPDNCAGNGNAGDERPQVNGPEDLLLPWMNGERY